MMGDLHVNVSRKKVLNKFLEIIEQRGSTQIENHFLSWKKITCT